MNAGLYQGTAGETDPALMTEVDKGRDVMLDPSSYTAWYEAAA